MKEDFCVLDTICVDVSVEDVLAQLGYPQGLRPSGDLQEKIRVQMAETLQLIEPKGAYLRLQKETQRGFELFSGVEGIVLALATIGGAVECRARQLVKTEQGAAALLVDAIGTVAAEQTADFVERKIREDFAGCDWEVSRRYSPGYCGWKIEAQREIFSQFPDTLGIELTTSCLMIPEKSLSFACLLSRTGDFSMIRIMDCRRCKQKACSYRSESFEA
jgi:hypothetical protein